MVWQAWSVADDFWEPSIVIYRQPLMALPVALGLSCVFALLAWRMRAVSLTGACAGAAVSSIVLFSKPEAFLILLLVFLLTWAATRLGRSRKLQAGIAERSAGRGARQVLANLGVGAAACGILSSLLHLQPQWPYLSYLLVAFIAAMAEATADTVSSEVGQAVSPRAWLLVESRWVPAGTDGAITALGTLAGAAGAALIGFAAIGLRVLYLETAWRAVAAGFLGMIFDTLLGGTLERRGKLGNDAVNFLSTLFAALLAIWWCR